MKVRTESGGVKDVGLLEVTAENFVCPHGEEHLYHCRIEVKKFNGETGERLSKPRKQVFGKKFFETFGLHNLRKQGYTVDILHDPNRWEAERKAAQEAASQAKAEEEARSEAERKAAEREAMKAEILEELKASSLVANASGEPSSKKKLKEEK